jgi:ribonuclease P protein component
VVENTGLQTGGFSRDHRLLTAAQFSDVFGHSGRLQSRHFILRYRVRENHLKQPRLGLAISRRHARRAVDRNRVKRLVRENFRVLSGQLGPVDLVFVSRPEIVQAENPMLSAEIQKLLRRLP